MLVNVSNVFSKSCGLSLDGALRNSENQDVRSRSIAAHSADISDPLTHPKLGEVPIWQL